MNADFIRHFLLRLIAWGILEPRIRRGAVLSPETLADLQQPLKLLRDTCAQAQVFFEELNLCRTCPAGCCGGDFSRFTVYDHIFHVAAGIAHPPGWGYRLFPVPRLRRHPSGKGMCGFFQHGKGCVLPYEIRPGLCVWWTCSRMNERFGKAEKARVMAIRHGFDAAYWEAAKILLRNGLRLPSDAGYGMRTRNVLADTYRLVMRQGISAGWAFLRPRLARISETILYEYRPSAGEQAGPIPDLTIVRVTRAGRFAYETDLVRAGAGFDLRFFRQGAVAYLAFQDGEAAGVGWRFPNSHHLRRLGYPPSAQYLAGCHVVPAYRRRGIYSALLRLMAQEAAQDGGPVVVETSPDNVASQAGLRKAGFVPVGRLIITVVAGIIVRYRFTRRPENSPGDSDSGPPTGN